MNRKYSIYITSWLLVLALIVGCSEDRKGPLQKNSNIPNPVTDVTVESLPGGARISYALPKDKDLLYVQATYSINNETVKQVKSSVFKNYLIIEGLPDIKEYKVFLSTINKSENVSVETVVNITPLESPLVGVFNALEVKETWGGAQVTMSNDTESEYVLYTLMKDSETNEWFEHDRFYTKSKKVDFYTRGLPPVEIDFGFYLTDKWQNSSDTLFVNLTPLYEVEFDRSLWSDLNLPDDSNHHDIYGDLTQLWTPGDRTVYFQDGTYPGMTIPNWITLDFGKKYIFGRFKLNQVSHHVSWMYGSCTPRRFEIWATNTPTTDWNDWVLMGEFESIKPSGLPIGDLSEDDIAASLRGEDYNFPLLDEGFRYFRFKTLETWGGTNFFCALEFTMYGQPAD